MVTGAGISNRSRSPRLTNPTARATSLESYERTAYVYDLTPGGEAAAEALAALDKALRRVGGLQAVALRHIEVPVTGVRDS